MIAQLSENTLLSSPMESRSPRPLLRPIIVLGVDRSGTSLVSEMIWKWGAYAGDLSHLTEANSNNPQGYWEYIPMQDVLHKVLESTGLPHCHADIDSRLAQQGVSPEIHDRAVRLVREMEAEGKPWLWKEPYLSLTLSFWEGLWKDPIYVIPVRNPHDSAVSFEKMFLTPALRDSGIRIIAMFLLRWQHFMLSILKHSERNPSTIFIPYEELLSNPQEQCRRLARFLDAETCMEPGDQRVAEMVKAVNPDLWRNKSRLAFADVPEATAEQKALFEYLHRKVRNPAEPFDPETCRLSPIWREYLQNFDLLFEMFNLD